MIGVSGRQFGKQPCAGFKASLVVPGIGQAEKSIEAVILGFGFLAKDRSANRQRITDLIPQRGRCAAGVAAICLGSGGSGRESIGAQM
jgi:hypothetical protein